MNLPVAVLLERTMWAGIAAFGFAVLFNVPKRTLLACTLSGAIGYGIRVALVEGHLLSLEAATLVAASAVSFLGVFFGRYWHAPALVFVIPGVIVMVPGALAFRTMIDILMLTTGSAAPVNDAALTAAVVSSIKTLLIVGALAAGVAVPSLLLRRHRPMT